MAKKPGKKRAKKRNEEKKPEDEWEKRGRSFGKRMEKQSKEFSDEMKQFGERFGRRMERWGREREWEWGGWWSATFGLLGPFIGSIIGIIFLAVGAWLVYALGLLFSSAFIVALSNFIFANLQWFFLASLFFGYSDYFRKKYPRTHWLFSPIIASIGAIVLIWLSVLLLDAINVFTSSSLITSVTGFIRANMAGIFVLILVFGYILNIIARIFVGPVVRNEHIDNI